MFAAWALWACGSSPEEDLARVQAFHRQRPEYERPLGVGTVVPEGLVSLSAASCGACHTEIYEEWRVSTHAAAWRDRQFQAEIGKSGNRWLCLNCHTPLLVQQDRWPVGLQDDDVERPVLIDAPAFDPALREEGITCAACHVREGMVFGPGVGTDAPHPVAVDPDYRSGALCLRCHQAVATYPGKGFVCTFETGTEWRAGPYDDQGVTCVDCHMPAQMRPAATGGAVRRVGAHWWRGAGIPKEEGVHPPLAANPPGLGLSATWGPNGVVVDVSNQRAGHRLPTGDPERWVQVDVHFVDAGGGTVGDAWQTRFGQKWRWHPVPEKLSDNRLLPLESRMFTVAAPPGAAAAVVEASSHRMEPETAEYHHLVGYPLSVKTHRLDVSP